MSKVTFDGPNKLIIINTGVTTIDVETEMYIPWKDWVLSGNSMFLAAFRTFGGDPTYSGQNAPSYYFLINGWRVSATGVNVIIQTNLYSDDYDNPFVTSNSTIISKNSDIPRVDSLTGLTSDITNVSNQLTGLTSSIDDVSIDLKLVLGLSQNNYRLSNQVYDSGQRLTSSTIKLYNSKTDCDNETNEFATYEMSATYNTIGLLTDYKVVKN